MAEYRRFVAYVYEYQKEKKGSNCGFVKIEVRGEICRIELHLQCPGLMPESRIQLSKFVRFDENNACTALNLICFFSLPYFPEKSKHFLGNAQKTAPNKGVCPSCRPA